MERFKNMDIGRICSFMGAFMAFLGGFFAYQEKDMTRAAIWAMICAGALVCWIDRIRRGRYLHMRLRAVDRLSGTGFEEYLKAHFSRMGYRVRLTEESHDYGADLILKRWGEVVVVQAKRYEKHVGMTAVQEAIGAVSYYDADRAMVVTNKGFTKSAHRLARYNDVELWGRNELKEHFHARE